jgi:sulfonate transport system substrate-binding protein
MMLKLKTVLLSAALAMPLAAHTTLAVAEDWPKTIRIGVQEADGLVALRASGQLEKALAPHGVKVEWLTFAYGPPLVEGINAGAVDLGTVGSTPPILAQAGSAPEVRYVAYSDPLQKGYGIVVGQDSNIHSVADLRGKHVATAKGSQGNVFLLQALRDAGVRNDEVGITFLAYSDARSAFERGDIDAWVVPDPRYADVELNNHARTILSIGQISVPQYSFYIATRGFAERYPATLRIVFDQLDRQEKLGLQNIDETAALMEKGTGVKASIWKVVIPRAGWGTHYPLSDDVIAAQQKSADLIYQNKLIPRPVEVRKAVVDVGHD